MQKTPHIRQRPNGSFYLTFSASDSVPKIKNGYMFEYEGRKYKVTSYYMADVDITENTYKYMVIAEPIESSAQ